ncbi:haloacid dehalogenase-like hydrolase family protein [Theileria parva strain Muguga]|uniref:Haloacid dehalogenase-like family hydrolase n=1 Tax=Theileria parva TaxID=5875 RepID=Q4N6U5_THEPA|nr:haloacid dehalogenase-like hydrolase family protein [Theileria parva strain Muguga]EAN34313.1 haloacid dehalogenase-like hydrolase family protein [Theileria parva strain Muguga]|eukprot:XP_766596.1 hypothetical protein [Theileria parva strain Muguga]
MTILSIVIFLLINVSSDPISNFSKPATPPKYFAIDIDGTFHIKDESKFKKNVEAFKRLKQKNTTPFFCTGRHLQCAKKLLGEGFFTETGYNGYPGVYLNGALVYDTNGKAFVDKFTPQFIDEFVNYVEQNNLNDKVFYYSPEGTFSLKELYKDGLQAIENNFITTPVVLSLSDLKSKDIIGITIFKTGLGGCISMSGVHSIEYTQHDITHITSLKCDKKIGLEKLLKDLGSNETECAYIGDDVKDVEAMEYCSMSFAVADAQEEAKNKAKWTLDLKHDECAFEKVVNLLLD